MQFVAEVGDATERSVAYVGGLAEIFGKSLRLLVVSPLKRGRIMPLRELFSRRVTQKS